MTARDPNLQSVELPPMGILAALGSFSYVFWIAGGMELVERAAYTGVRVVSTLYAKAPVADGGLGVDLATFGNLFAVWALIQSLLPIFTGVWTDRWGCRRTIFASTVLKLLGYVVMALWHSYAGFCVGAIILAVGTAIFKPALQGTLARTTTTRNSAVGWGIFYQTVNIGGFIGPIVGGALRETSWSYVFWGCALMISVNFALLFTYHDPRYVTGTESTPTAPAGGARYARRPVGSLWRISLRELLRPVVISYLLIFSGFWFMLMALFDVLPAYVEDWVDTRDIVGIFSTTGVIESGFWRRLLITDESGSQIKPEGIMNVNTFAIMLTCFLVTGLARRLPATTTMIAGTLLASLAMMICGHALAGLAVIVGVLFFSLGEMLASPKFIEFIANIAPADKKAMYLGFTQIPVAIGWTLEGKLGPTLYSLYSAKDTLARHWLLDGLRTNDLPTPEVNTLQALATSVAPTADQLDTWFRSDPERLVSALPQGTAFDWAVRLGSIPAETLETTLLEQYYAPTVWWVCASVGAASAIGIWLYGRFILKPAAEQRSL